MHKLLVLSTYNKNVYYDKMRDLTNNYIKFLKKDKNFLDVFLFFFITYDDKINKQYIFDDCNNTLIINGHETDVIGTHKTCNALQIINEHLNFNYSFLVRTNVSTIINIKNLINWLNSNFSANDCFTHPYYLSGYVLKLNWFDVGSGVTSTKYWGTEYASGTSILFSKKLVEDILNNRNETDETLADDLSFGVLIKKKKLSKIQYELTPHYAINKEEFSNDIFFYRNRTIKTSNQRCTNDRDYDIERMNKIYNSILSS